MPTGAASSPSYFLDAIYKILHFEPVTDGRGDPVYEAPNLVKLEKDPLKCAKNYFDDILCATPLLATYKESVDFHFKQLEQIIRRLHFHGAKINVKKM